MRLRFWRASWSTAWSRSGCGTRRRRPPTCSATPRPRSWTPSGNMRLLMPLLAGCWLLAAAVRRGAGAAAVRAVAARPPAVRRRALAHGRHQPERLRYAPSPPAHLQCDAAPSLMDAISRSGCGTRRRRPPTCSATPRPRSWTPSGNMRLLMPLLAGCWLLAAAVRRGAGAAAVRAVAARPPAVRRRALAHGRHQPERLRYAPSPPAHLQCDAAPSLMDAISRSGCGTRRRRPPTCSATPRPRSWTPSGNMRLLMPLLAGCWLLAAAVRRGAGAAAVRAVAARPPAVRRRALAHGRHQPERLRYAPSPPAHLQCDAAPSLMDAISRSGCGTRRRRPPTCSATPRPRSWTPSGTCTWAAAGGRPSGASAAAAAPRRCRPPIPRATRRSVRTTPGSY
ncbi:hypothetical protein ACJJTC_002236 [Scirpophaga incertulas]